MGGVWFKLNSDKCAGGSCSDPPPVQFDGYISDHSQTSLIEKIILTKLSDWSNIDIRVQNGFVRALSRTDLFVCSRIYRCPFNLTSDKFSMRVLLDGWLLELFLQT